MRGGCIRRLWFFKQEYLNNNNKAQKFIDWKERFDNRDNCELGKINFVLQYES